MKYLVGLLIVVGCGASQKQLEETPTATTHRVHEEAPAASTSDLDREGVRQTFQQMQNSQNAYHEVHLEQKAGEAGSGAGSALVPPPPPKKTGPAEQAPKS